MVFYNISIAPERGTYQQPDWELHYTKSGPSIASTFKHYYLHGDQTRLSNALSI